MIEVESRYRNVIFPTYVFELDLKEFDKDFYKEIISDHIVTKTDPLTLSNTDLHTDERMKDFCDFVLEQHKSIMHTMGFRHFDLFGFDCSMEEPTEEQKKETTGAEDEEPKPKYFKVGVGDKNYWTTGELLAMAQDCERTFTNPPMEMSLNLFGKDTLVSSLWELQPKPKTFEETFDG